MIYSCPVAFGAKYLTGMVTSVSSSVLLEIVFFVSLKKLPKMTSKIQISEVYDL